MDPLIGYNAADILEQANAELIEDGRRGAIQQIKLMFIAEMNLSKEIAEVRKKLSGLEKNLEDKRATIAKIKSGDWSVIPVKLKEEVKKNEKSDDRD